MATQTFSVEINHESIKRKVQNGTFKFGKARETDSNSKLTNNVKATDIASDDDILTDSLERHICMIIIDFSKYFPQRVTTEQGKSKVDTITFTLPGEWENANGAGFKADIHDYLINAVMYDFLALSLPKEAEFYQQKALVSLQGAERKLFYKRAV